MFKSLTNLAFRATIAQSVILLVQAQLEEHLGAGFNAGIQDERTTEHTVTPDYDAVRKTLSGQLDTFKDRAPQLYNKKFTYREMEQKELLYFTISLAHQLFSSIIGSKAPVINVDLTSTPTDQDALTAFKIRLAGEDYEQWLSDSRIKNVYNDRLKHLVLTGLGDALQTDIVARTMSIGIEKLNNTRNSKSTTGSETEYMTLFILDQGLKRYFGLDAGIIDTSIASGETQPERDHFLRQEFTPARQALGAILDNSINPSSKSTLLAHQQYIATALAQQLFSSIIGSTLPILGPTDNPLSIAPGEEALTTFREKIVGPNLYANFQRLVLAGLDDALSARSGLVIRTFQECERNITRKAAADRTARKSTSRKAADSQPDASTMASLAENAEQPTPRDNTTSPLKQAASVLPPSSNSWVQSTSDSKVAQPRGYTREEVVDTIVKVTKKNIREVSEALRKTATAEAISGDALTTGDITKTLKSLGSANPMGDAIKVTSAINATRGSRIAM